MIRTGVQTGVKQLRGVLLRKRCFAGTTHGGAHGEERSPALGATAVLLGAATGALLLRGSLPKPSPAAAGATNPIEPATETRGETVSSSGAPTDEPGPHNDFGAPILDPDDPYGVLPEHDDETHCSLCRTFRQGPCRTYWRRTEACWKEKDADACMKYSVPFFHCTQYYQNLYHLIVLHNYQKDYDRLQDFDTSETAAWDEDDSNHSPSIDFSKWIEFRKDLGPSFSQSIPSAAASSSDPPLPLWQRIPPETDPILIPCDVRVPKVLADGAVLYLAYTTDQDGMVLGVKEMREPNEEASTAEESDETTENTPPAADQSTANETTERTLPADDDQEPTVTETASPHVDFLCLLLPGETESVVLSAVYAKTDATVLLRKVYPLSQVDKQN